MPNHDDALAYVELASECIARGTWYPDVHNQYDDFIFGPGYVNLLIGIYHLFGSFSFVRLLNLLMNIAMVLCRFGPAACLDCFPDRTECEEENRSFCLSSGVRRL